MWLCRSCGNKMADGNNFCTVCGTANVGDSPAPQPSAQEMSPAVGTVDAPASTAPPGASADPQAQPPTTPGSPTLTDPLHCAVYDALTVSRQSSLAGRLTGTVLSLIIFFFIAWRFQGYSTIGALMLIGVIFIHEMGHWLGMKALGYHSTSIMFIPFLGAAASGSDPQPSGAKHAVVSLLGPAPGILLGIAAGVVWLVTKEKIAMECTFTFLLLNLFNLAPIYPLDGGQVLEATLFNRHYMADLVFRVLMGILLALLAYGADWWGLGFLAFFIFTSLGARRRVGLVAQQLHDRIPLEDRTNAGLIPTRWLEVIVTMLQAQTPRQANAAKLIATELRAVWERLCYRQPSAVISAVILLSYFGMFMVGLIATIVFGGIWAANQPPPQ